MPKRLYFETTETITKNKKGWIEVDTDFTQIYHCINDISTFINSSTSWKLLFWLLANETGKYNGIIICRPVWEKFNEHLKEKDKKSAVTYRTFQNCLMELHSAKALTRVGKGHYYFNPHIFWKDDKTERLDFIKDETLEGRYISHNPLEKNLP